MLTLKKKKKDINHSLFLYHSPANHTIQIAEFNVYKSN